MCTTYNEITCCSFPIHAKGYLVHKFYCWTSYCIKVHLQVPEVCISPNSLMVSSNQYSRFKRLEFKSSQYSINEQVISLKNLTGSYLKARELLLGKFNGQTGNNDNIVKLLQLAVKHKQVPCSYQHHSV